MLKKRIRASALLSAVLVLTLSLFLYQFYLEHFKLAMQENQLIKQYLIK